MIRDHLSDVRITSQDEFEAVLCELVETAIHEDVDVRGVWKFRTSGSTHDWEVEIVELVKEEEDETT